MKRFWMVLTMGVAGWIFSTHAATLFVDLNAPTQHPLTALGRRPPQTFRRRSMLLKMAIWY